MVYYGLSFGVVGDLKQNNPYIIFAFLAIIEIPFICVCAFAMKYLGRKKPLGFFLLVIGLCCIGSIYAAEYDTNSSVLLLMIGKGAISAACTALYVYSGEIYPTDIRNTALGVGSVFSRFGGMVAPFFLTLVRSHF
jgi:solute carrier family 22 (organic cation transporter), member 15